MSRWLSEDSTLALGEARSTLEVHWDDCDHLRDLGSQARLEPVAQGGELSGATRTSAQQGHLYRAVFVHLDELYIASVCDQGGPQTVQHALHGVSQRMSDPFHDLDVFGSSATYAERSLSLREPRGSLPSCA